MNRQGVSYTTDKRAHAHQGSREITGCREADRKGQPIAFTPRGGDDTTSDREFIEDLSELRNARSDLRYKVDDSPDGAEQITPRMREVRQLLVEERRDLYVKERLEEQANWYAGKSEANRVLANRLFWASLAAQFVAMGLAVWQPAGRSLQSASLLSRLTLPASARKTAALRSR